MPAAARSTESPRHRRTRKPRECEQCGASLAGYRRDARVCGNRCRVRKHRRLHPRLRRGLTREHREALKLFGKAIPVVLGGGDVLTLLPPGVLEEIETHVHAKLRERNQEIAVRVVTRVTAHFREQGYDVTEDEMTERLVALGLLVWAEDSPAADQARRLSSKAKTAARNRPATVSTSNSNGAAPLTRPTPDDKEESLAAT